jgi:hypothetical protein
MKIRPIVKLRYGRQNEPIRIPIANLLQDPLAQTYLTNDFAASNGVLTVQNITGFAVNQILFIGNIGNGNSEIIPTHVSTAPVSGTITLNTSTVQAHSNSDYVRAIPFDQVEISKASTLTGTKTVLTTMSLDVLEETVYNDTTLVSGYYFARFKNSVTSAFSDYSDGCPVGSYAINTARYIIDSALAEINKKVDNLFTNEFGFMQINNCQTEVLKELKRWSWMKVYGATYPASVGTWRVALPSDIDDTNTNKSIENLKIGDTGNLTWVDKGQWNNLTTGVYWTTLASTLSIGASTVTLSTSNDFDASGTITIGGSTLTYTANSKTTGVLTLSAVSTVTFPAGQDVFQHVNEGTPAYVTYFDGYLWHYPVLDATYDGMNYTMDYYSQLTPITSDTDTIVVPDPILVKEYLIWKYLRRMNNGQEDDASSYAYQNYEKHLAKLKKTEVSGVRIVMKPRFNDYSKLMSAEGDNKFVRTQGYWPTNY